MESALESKLLKGPILTLSMEELVEGHEQLGHNLVEWIYSVTDQIPGLAEHHVKLVDGKFCVYYLTYEDIEELEKVRK
jgi:hypothetical protein